jgi:NDP-sugar pyrophosphorylase family protein
MFWSIVHSRNELPRLSMFWYRHILTFGSARQDRYFHFWSNFSFFGDNNFLDFQSKKEEKMMEAIILAGGMGKRLRPLTKDIPKAMVPVNGVPLLEYQLRRLEKAGVDRIVLACGYKWQVIRNAFGKRFIYSVEKEPLGTAGAVNNALDKIDGKEFLVVNADDITDANLKELIKMGSNTTAVARFHSNFGIVEIRGNKIIKFQEKPLLPYWANVGLHILNKKIKFPPKGSLEYDVLPGIAAKGKLKVYKHRGFWMTVNTTKDLEEVEDAIKNKGIRLD